MLMGLQLIVKAERKKIEKSLGHLHQNVKYSRSLKTFSAFQFQSEFSHPWVKMLFYKNLNNSSVLTFGRGAGKNRSDVGFGEFQP
jgi:hypothetical protein